MKKVLLTFCIAIALAMTACGPSAKEIEAKRIADSIRVADSMALVQAEATRIADSIATAEKAKAFADSVAACQKVKCTKKGK
jgi:hypothetical protein